MKKSEFLRRAWNKISTRDKWVQDSYHIRYGGKDRYCMVGAMKAARRDFASEIHDDVEAKLIYEDVRGDLRKQFRGGIEHYNDCHSWEALKKHVFALIDRLEAVEKAAESPQVELIEQKPKVVRRVKELIEKQVEKEVVR